MRRASGLSVSLSTQWLHLDAHPCYLRLSDSESNHPIEGDTRCRHHGTTARTGQTCPESGVWEVVGTPSTTAPIAKGNTMPPYAGKAVTWELIQKA